MVESQLDYISQMSMDLADAISANEADRETLIHNHIQKVSHVEAIEDFKKDLEWVNVSEPLSLSTHCADKIVVLDFWTYCCINCIHVLTDLQYIEKKISVEDGLVVIGVHSAKFGIEKNSKNILSAVEKYKITHPVVNDASLTMWNTLGILCWPTLVVLGPGNKPLFILVGEGNREKLEMYVKAALKYYGPKISKKYIPISLNSHIEAIEESILKFPSKIALNPFYHGKPDEVFIAISDTGHHRIVCTDYSGAVLRIIGGKQPGFQDGKLSEARFNFPHGLCWLTRNILVVCDTGNHSLRTIHLDDNKVELLAGTGTQSEFGDAGGKYLGLQALNSPWDVVLFSVPDMDMSLRKHTFVTEQMPLPSGNEKGKDEASPTVNEKNDDLRRVLLVACAGSHQIWAVFLDTTIWWKYKTFTEGTCVRIAGSGLESAQNNSYPHNATFAQPSGLAIKPGNKPELYIADSESSTIRTLLLSSGHVLTVAGGDRNPHNLMAYGDVDDHGTTAKFQHPLCVAYAEKLKMLFVADTYNNKVRKIDSNYNVTSVQPTIIESSDPVLFSEPSGLSLTNDNKYLYIADANNHSIKILNVAKSYCEEFRIHYPECNMPDQTNFIQYQNDMFINRKLGTLIVFFNVSLDCSQDREVKFTPGAPQNWSLSIRDEENKEVTEDTFEFVNRSNKGSTLPGRIEMKLKERTDSTHFLFYLRFQTVLCEKNSCFTHIFTMRSNLLVRDSVKPIESYKITCKINPGNEQWKKGER